jgi:hypothetical protein
VAKDQIPLECTFEQCFECCLITILALSHLVTAQTCLFLNDKDPFEMMKMVEGTDIKAILDDGRANAEAVGVKASNKTFGTRCLPWFSNIQGPTCPQSTYHIQVSSGHSTGVSDIINISIDCDLLFEKSRVMVIYVPAKIKTDSRT